MQQEDRIRRLEKQVETLNQSVRKCKTPVIFRNLTLIVLKVIWVFFAH